MLYRILNWLQMMPMNIRRSLCRHDWEATSKKEGPIHIMKCAKCGSLYILCSREAQPKVKPFQEKARNAIQKAFTRTRMKLMG